MPTPTTTTTAPASPSVSTGPEFLRRDSLFPDHDIPIVDKDANEGSSSLQLPSEIIADNVAGIQPTRVAGIFYPQNAQDVKYVMQLARTNVRFER